MRNRVPLFVSILAIALMTTGGALSAGSPADDTAEPTAPDRVVLKLDQNVFTAAERRAVLRGPAVKTSKAVAIPTDEQPEVGETVLVRYADANVMHQSITAGCTISSTAGTPTKSPGYVSAITSYQQTGCSGIIQATGALGIYFGFQWLVMDSVSWTPQNGALTTVVPLWHCNNSNQSPFRSTVRNKYSNSTSTIINVSSEVNFACGR